MYITTGSRVYHMIGDIDTTRRQAAELQLQEMFLIKNISFCDLKFTSALAMKPCVSCSQPTTGSSGMVMQVYSWKTRASLAWVLWLKETLNILVWLNLPHTTRQPRTLPLNIPSLLFALWSEGFPSLSQHLPHVLSQKILLRKP